VLHIRSFTSFGGIVRNGQDISAKETAEKQGSWVPKTHEYEKWEKSPFKKKAKGQEDPVCVNPFLKKQDRSKCGLFM